MVEPEGFGSRIAKRMGPPRRGEAGRRHGRRLLLLALFALPVVQSTAVGQADEPTVEPAETTAGFVWKPSGVTATAGGAVAFRNPSAVTPHGVHWTGGPEKPSCSGVPVDAFATSWSGACTFAGAGTYTFVCTVHPEEMKGTITVAGSGEPAPPPPAAPGQVPAPSEGRVVEALLLAKSQHGGFVRGSIAVSPAALGGSLIIELEARRGARRGQGKALVRVGKLARSLSKAGPQPFAVPLAASARRTLKSRGHLSLSVEISVKPPSSARIAITRRIELHE
jgi:plastocyanin